MKIFNKLKCLCGLHAPQHEAEKQELGFSGRARYYSRYVCKHCKKVLSEKSDIL